MNQEESWPLKAYTHKELSRAFDVSWPTLKKWLKPYEKLIGKKKGHFYTILQVQMIFDKLGTPMRKT